MLEGGDPWADLDNNFESKMYSAPLTNYIELKKIKK